MVPPSTNLPVPPEIGASGNWSEPCYGVRTVPPSRMSPWTARAQHAQGYLTGEAKPEGNGYDNHEQDKADVTKAKIVQPRKRESCDKKEDDEEGKRAKQSTRTDRLIRIRDQEKQQYWNEMYLAAQGQEVVIQAELAMAEAHRQDLQVVMQKAIKVVRDKRTALADCRVHIKRLGEAIQAMNTVGQANESVPPAARNT